MRLLALADVAPHAAVDALAAQQEVDAVVCLGDLQPAWLEGLERVDVPTLGVYGNHDEDPYLPRAGARDLHLATASVDGITFSGFEGCVRYRPGGGPQYTQEEAAQLVTRLPPADVLLCHCPPAGVNDDPSDRAHTGFTALRDWIERQRPAYLLHGHTHPEPWRAVRSVGPTRVVHVHGARVVEVGV